jgi:predicted dehydrogenase
MGLIGAGTMGTLYARAFAECGSAELVAICDVDLEKADALATVRGVPASYADCAEMLEHEQLDAATVATPDFHHREPVIACLEAGADVLCEKPLATTTADCDAICDAVRRSGRRLMVNFGNRHKRKVYALKERLDAGELGDVQNVFIHLREPIDKTRTLRWIGRTTATFFLLSHCTDTVMYLIGGMPERVYARAGYGVLAARGIETPDSVVAVLSFEGGATVTMDANWIMPEGFAPRIDFPIELIGRKGAAYADLRSHDLMLYGEGARSVDYDFSSHDPLGRVGGWWFDSVGYFVECLERGVEPEPNAEDGARVTRVLLAIEESAQSGDVVTL